MLRFYRFKQSTNVERVALVLAHKGIEVESVLVDPDDRANVREASGQELVPVLVDGDEVVTDSTRIMHWLEDRHPDRPVFPADPAPAAEVEIFIDWFNRVWKREPNMIADALDAGRAGGEDLDRWAARLQRRLDFFEGLLSGRDHLFGEFGAADCAAYPFLRYAVGIDQDDPWTFHRVIHERMPLQPHHVNLRAWIGRMGERPMA
ncbi:MAG TPA: glutathione S-transferase family protein [Solirubrobacteraceae bacterium]|nr:glutathione S-transferase family protein [Solirubrobacteraceae bacterium]